MKSTKILLTLFENFIIASMLLTACNGVTTSDG